MEKEYILTKGMYEDTDVKELIEDVIIKSKLGFNISVRLL